MTDEELMLIQGRVGRQYVFALQSEGLTNDELLKTTLAIFASILLAATDRIDDDYNVDVFRERLALTLAQAREVRSRVLQ